MRSLPGAVVATASSMTITVLVWRRYAQIPAAAQPDDNVRFPLAPTPGAGHAQVMELDAEACYRAVQSRDTRFDGQFFTAVHTTGIYCRPSCPAITPKRQNVSFHPTTASAQAAGYRPAGAAFPTQHRDRRCGISSLIWPSARCDLSGTAWSSATV